MDASPAFRTAVRTMMRRSRRFRLVGEAATASDAMILAARLRPGLALVDVDLPHEVRASGLSYLDKAEVSETALSEMFPRPTTGFRLVESGGLRRASG